MQLAKMIPVQYVNDLYANLCKKADVYDESTWIDIFIERVDPCICHSLHEY